MQQTRGASVVVLFSCFAEGSGAAKSMGLRLLLIARGKCNRWKGWLFLQENVSVDRGVSPLLLPYCSTVFFIFLVPTRCRGIEASSYCIAQGGNGVFKQREKSDFQSNLRGLRPK